MSRIGRLVRSADTRVEIPLSLRSLGMTEEWALGVTGLA